MVKGLSLNVDKTKVIKFNLNYFHYPLPVFLNKHTEIKEEQILNFPVWELINIWVGRFILYK
jgi:hypothetical protein